MRSFTSPWFPGLRRDGRRHYPTAEALARSCEHFQQAVVHTRSQDFAAAVRDLRAAAALDPRSGPVTVALAHILIKVGDIDAALEEVRRLVPPRPSAFRRLLPWYRAFYRQELTGYHLTAARVLEAGGRERDALTEWEEITRLSPQSDAGKLAREKTERRRESS